MAEVPKRELSELSIEELRDIVSQMRDALWPDGDSDHHWGSGTLQDVSQILFEHGLQL